MNQIVITKNLAAKGMRVVRGPGWEWGEQDGGKGEVGTIIEDLTGEDGVIPVQWSNGTIFYYRVGSQGKYDLAMYDPFTSTGMSLTNPQSQRVQGIRQALSQSIKKADSLIEKSNTKHGNSNTNSDHTGPIKVRRPISKIQGSKR